MYNKILVPLDGSQLAAEILPYAGIFAEAYAIHH
jgi:nucleotide-binding universal stress UspA family protein